MSASGAAFRRAIVIEAEPHRVVAALQDDFHRFGVTLGHDGGRVTAVEGRALRYPWATCLEAPDALAALVGAPVAADPTTLFSHADPRLHCTHLFELAALALAQAARGAGARRYEAEVTDPEGDGRVARLFQDSEPVLEWRLAGETITGPAPYAGHTPNDFGSRALAELEPALAERLLILRRVVQTARGRQMAIDAYPNAAAMARAPACYSLQPANAPRARRIPGSVRNWPNRADLLASVAGLSDGAKPRP